VGIEDVRDILADLEQGLRAVAGKSAAAVGDERTAAQTAGD
jgi:hypothetical protein